MKRFIALIMLGCMILSLTGCAGDNRKSDAEQETDIATVTPEKPEETSEPEETPEPEKTTEPEETPEATKEATRTPIPTETPTEIPETPTPEPQPEDLVTMLMYCTSDSAAVYKERDIQSEQATQLTFNAEVKVIESAEDWTVVVIDNEIYYVETQYLTDDAQWIEKLGPAEIGLDPSWEFAGYSMINSGKALLFRASANRKNIIVGVNAGHGTVNGTSYYTYCHPDMTPKTTGGSTSAGAIQATAIATGMTFYDGTPEKDVTLRQAQILRNMLLEAGYDVLMIRDSDDVQLDNIARTVICNNCAACHIAIHWDGDGLDYDKGCYYMSVADGIKGMYPVSEIWQEDNRLGECLIEGLRTQNVPIFESGSMQADLTQTSYSKIPSVDIELGNAASSHTDDDLTVRAAGMLAGINLFFGF